MSKQKRSWLRVVEPRVVIAPGGVRLRPPRLRIGSKGVGVYLGRHGLSVTLRPLTGVQRARRQGCAALPCGVLMVGSVMTTATLGQRRRRRR